MPGQASIAKDYRDADYFVAAVSLVERYGPDQMYAYRLGYEMAKNEAWSRRALALTVTTQVSRCRKRANFGCSRFGC